MQSLLHGMVETLALAAHDLEDADLLEALTSVLSERHSVLAALVESAAEKIFLPASVLTNYRYTGHIKSYNAQKGYGFIQCADLKETAGGDVFLHGNKIGAFQVGDEINFAALLSKDNKLRAFDVIPGKAEANGSVIGPPGAVKGKGPPAWGAPAPYQPPAAYQPAWGKQPPGKAWGKQSVVVSPPSCGYADAGTGYADPGKGYADFGKGKAGSFGWSPPPPASAFGKGKSKESVKGQSKERDPKGSIVTCFDMPGVTDARFEGQIKNFNEKNGYGFISSEELSAAMGEQVDAFLHRDEIGAHEIGSSVTFGVILSKDGRPRAQELSDIGGGGKRQRIS